MRKPEGTMLNIKEASTENLEKAIHAADSDEFKRFLLEEIKENGITSHERELIDRVLFKYADRCDTIKPKTTSMPCKEDDRDVLIKVVFWMQNTYCNSDNWNKIIKIVLRHIRE